MTQETKRMLSRLTLAAVASLLALVAHAQQPKPRSGDGDWTMPARDYASTRFSPLNQVTTANVASLKVEFTFSTGVNRGQEAAPIVVGDTMYIVTPYPNIVYALDLTSRNPKPPRRASPVATSSIAASSMRTAASSSTRSTATRSRSRQPPASCCGRPS
jgi:glucose dehydrogenase